MRKIGLISAYKNKNFYYHFIYWTINVLFFTLVFSSKSNFDNFWVSLHENIAYLPSGILFTYFSVNYLIPNYFFKNRIALFIAFQLAVFLLYPVISNIVKTFYIDPVIYGTHPEYRIERVLSIVLILLFDIFPLAGVQILKHIRTVAVQSEISKHEKIEAELKLREAELKLLKSQIQPHFLFNTLNNLYSLSIQKSERTSDVIIKISDLLNYIIYDCNTDKVSLEKEFEFIQSYIDLEKLRYDDSLKIITNISGDLHGKFIAPMILHTFIENSFKHGASKDTGNPWININLSIKANWLNFTVINSKLNDDNNSLCGIGIENAKKRLQLIYPNQHSLEIENKKNTFNISLEIQV